MGGSNEFLHSDKQGEKMSHQRSVAPIKPSEIQEIEQRELPGADDEQMPFPDSVPASPALPSRIQDLFGQALPPQQQVEQMLPLAPVPPALIKQSRIQETGPVPALPHPGQEQMSLLQRARVPLPIEPSEIQEADPVREQVGLWLGSHRGVAGRPASAQAWEMLTRMAKDEYECMVCVVQIGRRARTWTCHRCYVMLHLSCIRRWSSSSYRARPAEGAGDQGAKQWPCPGCMLHREALPTDYVCFCGRMVDPPFDPHGTPHSCNQPCARTHRCAHACELPCHPGACPPCKTCVATGRLRQLCIQKCVNVDSRLLRPCGHPYAQGEPLQDPPSDPPSGRCLFPVRRPCRCKRELLVLSCDALSSIPGTDRQEGEGEEADAGTPAAKQGALRCSRRCNLPLGCARHRCEDSCCARKHGGLSDVRRPVSFPGSQDPTQVCGQGCGYVQNCGHACVLRCHPGACPPCVRVLPPVTCHCGRTALPGPPPRCGTPPPPSPACSEICLSPRPCGHPCRDPCHAGACAPCTKESLQACAGDHDAVLVACVTRSPQSRPPCQLACGRALGCGHTCQRKCHPGSCAAWGSVDARGERPCGQQCQASRAECDHLCAERCHPARQCAPCLHKVEVPCACGRVRVALCSHRQAGSKICAHATPLAGAAGPGEGEDEDEGSCDEGEDEGEGPESAPVVHVPGTLAGCPFPYPEIIMKQLIKSKLQQLHRFEALLTQLCHKGGTKYVECRGPARWLLQQVAAYYRIESNPVDTDIQLKAGSSSAAPCVSMSSALSMCRKLAHLPRVLTSKLLPPTHILHVRTSDAGARSVDPLDIRVLLRRWEKQCHLNWVDDKHLLVIVSDQTLLVELAAKLQKQYAVELPNPPASAGAVSAPPRPERQRQPRHRPKMTKVVPVVLKQSNPFAFFDSSDNSSSEDD